MLRKVVQFQDCRWLFRRDGGYILETNPIFYEDAIIMLVEHAAGLSNQVDRVEGFEFLLKKRVPEEDLRAVKEQLYLEWRRRACPMMRSGSLICSNFPGMGDSLHATEPCSWTSDDFI